MKTKRNGPPLKYSAKEVDALVAEVQPTIKRIGLYEGMYCKTEYKCLTCAHTWYPVISNILKRKSGCPKCSSKARGAALSVVRQAGDYKKVQISAHDILKQLRKIRCSIDEELPESVYQSTMVSFSCNKCSNVSAYTAKALMKGAARCVKCWQKSYGRSQRISHEEFAASFPWYRFLTKYKTSYKTLTTECLNCGHIKTSIAGGLKECGKCIMRKFPTKEIFVKELSKSNPTLELVGDEWRQYEYTKFKCKTCLYEWDAVPQYMLKGYGCPKCNCGNSRPQKLIQAFVEKLGVAFEPGNRKVLGRRELDIYVEEKKIAIEVNGIFWHNDMHKNSDYHLTKTLECKNKGIQLLQFWDAEIYNSTYAIKSLIMSKLGLHKHAVYARKLDLHTVDPKEARSFLDKHHIQGFVPAKVYLGLYQNDEKLLAVMSFGKPRIDKHAEWELLRFAVHAGYHIPGGASKLLTNFERQYTPKSLVSYADLRYSYGRMYKKLGFELTHVSKPGYFYAKQTTIISRYKAQKHKLSQLLGDKFNENWSERDNMANAGYSKVYDCGQLVLHKIY